MEWNEESYRRLVQGEAHGFAASLLLGGLRALSLPYAAATTCRNLAYDAGWKHAAATGVPVISVGNLTVGGTGKTPMVEHIVRCLLDRQIRVAVLSRGYGADRGPNDEALVLAENLPGLLHLQGADRVQLARQAIEQCAAEALVLDDGFQHRRLHRDLDLVLIDALCPFGGGWQLPGGLLRESVRGLRRADVIVLTRADTVNAAARMAVKTRINRIAGPRPWATVRFAPTQVCRFGGAGEPAAALKNRGVLAFCGIGNPAGFLATLTSLGARILGSCSFPDHHAYRARDLDQLAAWIRVQQPDLVVTTQKDLVKLRVDQLAAVPLVAVKIEARFDEGQAELGAALDRVLETVPTCRGKAMRRHVSNVPSLLK